MGLNTFDEDYYYTPVHQRRRRSDRGNYGGTCLSFLRVLMIGVNILFAATSIACIVFSVLDRDKVEAALQTVCHSCSRVFMGYVFGLSILLCFSLLGLFSLCFRNIFLYIFYSCYLLVVFLAALTVSVVYSLIATEHLDLATAWNNAATHDNAGLCAFQLQFQCSGWETQCTVGKDNVRCLEGHNEIIERFPAELTGSLVVSVGGGVTPAKSSVLGRVTSPSVFGQENESSFEQVCPVCEESDQNTINTFTSTCQYFVMSAIRKYMRIVLPIGYSVTAVACVAMIGTWILYIKETEQSLYPVRYYQV